MIVDVAAADGLLQVKRNGVGGTCVGHSEADANVQNTIEAADAAFGFRVNGVTKVRDKAAERIVASVGVIKIPIPKTVVELKVFGCESKVRAKKRFEVKERGLRGKAGSGRFVIDLADA